MSVIFAGLKLVVLIHIIILYPFFSKQNNKPVAKVSPIFVDKKPAKTAASVLESAAKIPAQDPCSKARAAKITASGRPSTVKPDNIIPQGLACTSKVAKVTTSGRPSTAHSTKASDPGRLSIAKPAKIGAPGQKPLTSKVPSTRPPGVLKSHNQSIKAASKLTGPNSKPAATAMSTPKRKPWVSDFKVIATRSEVKKKPKVAAPDSKVTGPFGKTKSKLNNLDKKVGASNSKGRAIPGVGKLSVGCKPQLSSTAKNQGITSSRRATFVSASKDTKAARSPTCKLKRITSPAARRSTFAVRSITGPSMSGRRTTMGGDGPVASKRPVASKFRAVASRIDSGLQNLRKQQRNGDAENKASKHSPSTAKDGPVPAKQPRKSILRPQDQNAAGDGSFPKTPKSTLRFGSLSRIEITPNLARNTPVKKEMSMR